MDKFVITVKDFFLTVVFLGDDAKKQILLINRRDMPVGVLTGVHMEKDEQSAQTALREVKEETGYQVEIIKKVGEFSYHNSDKINHTYICKIISKYKH